MRRFHSLYLHSARPRGTQMGNGPTASGAPRSRPQRWAGRAWRGGTRAPWPIFGSPMRGGKAGADRVGPKRWVKSRQGSTTKGCRVNLVYRTEAGWSSSAARLHRARRPSRRTAQLIPPHPTDPHALGAGGTKFQRCTCKEFGLDKFTGLPHLAADGKRDKFIIG